MFYGAITADGQSELLQRGQEPPLVIGAKHCLVARRREARSSGLLTIATYEFETVSLALATW